MRPKKYLGYLAGAFATVMAALAYPDITTILAWVGLLGGIAWWAWPVASQKMTTEWKRSEDTSVTRQIQTLRDYQERKSA
jgi:hypothetical protein